MNKIFIMMFFISFFLLFVSIHASIGTKAGFYPNSSNYNDRINKESDDAKEFLLEILHGKIPFEMYEELNSQNLTYDLDFIIKINKNSNCPYIINNTNNPAFDGVFLGAGINLLNFSREEINNINGLNSKYLNKSKILELCNKTRSEALSGVNMSDCISNEGINVFNKHIIDHIISVKMDKTFVTKNNLHRSFFNSFISLYISMSKISPEIYNNYNNITSLSYITENMLEDVHSPFSRLIQSKLMNLMDGNIKYNNSFILFLIPQIFGEENEDIENFISKFSSTVKENTNENSFYISIKNSESAKKNDAYSNKDIGGLFDLKNKSENIVIDLDKAYKEIVSSFQKNGKSDLYKNKIVIFLSTNEVYYNSQTFENANSFIEKLQKNESIQTIPIILMKNKSDVTDKMKYNILVNEFNTDVNIRKTLFAISNMHSYIYLPYNKSIENIVNSDLDTPIFFELNYDDQNESYIIEFKFDNSINYKYNIFASDINPYPSIKNYTKKILVYYNNPNPKLKVESKQFYISVECIGKFDLVINENGENFDDSSYNYEEKTFNSSINFVSIADRNVETKKFLTFGSDYKLKNFFSNWTFENFLKYTMRGIDRYNAEDIDFFNSNLFIYLFNDAGLINRVYSFGGNNFYFGRNLSLSDYTPLTLKNENLDQLTINKLYYFLQNSTIIYNSSNSAPSVYFDDEEIKIIFNITHKRCLTFLRNALNRAIYTQFDQQETHLKFIMYCLYFMSPNDKLITKRIQSLDEAEKKYSEVINYLYGLYDKNSGLNNVIKFLITWLQHFIQYKNIDDKALVSLIIGKSLILDENEYNFTDNFFTTINKKTTRIALSVYDTLNNKIENVIPIYKNPSSKERLNLVNDYKKLYDENTKKLYNGTQKMNLNQILDYSINEFKRFDSGIKKVLFILTDENFLTEKNYYINNILTELNYDKHSDLINNEIHLVIATTKNYEKGEIHELFTLDSSGKIPYTIEENYFHYENINKTNIYMEGFSHLLAQSIISININKRMLKDVYEGGISYYKVYTNEVNTTLIVNTNFSAFKVSVSRLFPFPNEKNYNSSENGLDKIEENRYGITLDSSYNRLLYISFEAVNKKEKQFIEIFSCEDSKFSNCNLEYTSKIQWLIFAFVVVCFILGLIVYNLKCSYSIDQKQINIFG